MAGKKQIRQENIHTTLQKEFGGIMLITLFANKNMQ